MYICPICREKLKLSDRSYRCRNRHCFDISAKGYVNLLTTKGRNPSKAGDDKLMLRSRTDFLDSGAYAPLADRLCGLMGELVKNIKQPNIIDSGCGEGFYTCALAGIEGSRIWGIDISKHAVSHCMTRITNSHRCREI